MNKAFSRFEMTTRDFWTVQAMKHSQQPLFMALGMTLTYADERRFKMLKSVMLVEWLDFERKGVKMEQKQLGITCGKPCV